MSDTLADTSADDTLGTNIESSERIAVTIFIRIGETCLGLRRAGADTTRSSASIRFADLDTTTTAATDAAAAPFTEIERVTHFAITVQIFSTTVFVLRQAGNGTAFQRERVGRVTHECAVACTRSDTDSTRVTTCLIPVMGLVVTVPVFVVAPFGFGWEWMGIANDILAVGRAFVAARVGTAAGTDCAHLVEERVRETGLVAEIGTRVCTHRGVTERASAISLA